MSIDRGTYPIPQETASVIDLFEEMTEIPRPSGNEDGIRNWLVAFALENRFEANIDVRGNMTINVPASPGREDLPSVILQGHMDMVTIPGTNDTKPTKAHIDEEGWLRSDGTTTLGADNGIGVASALAIAKDENFEHGPFTILVTVNEEAPPMGITQLDPGIVPADSMFWVNLDSEEGAGLICRGCAASCDIKGVLEIGERENLPDVYRVVEIKLSGLKGGHSGIEIHEKRGNAVQLLADWLLAADALMKSRYVNGNGLKLIDFNGGVKRNAIPSSACCTVAVPSELYEAFCHIITDIYPKSTKSKGVLNALSPENADKLSIEIKELPSGDVKAISDNVRTQALRTMALIENGVYEQVPDNSGITHGVLLSSNIGVAGISSRESGEEAFSLVSMVRGAKIESLKRKVSELKAAIGYHLGDNVTSGDAGGAWLEDLESPAVQAAVRAATAAGLDPKIFAYHAGLECARGNDVLEAAGRRRLPSVSVGPLLKGVHSQDERVSVQSVDETLRFIKELMAEMWNSADA